MNYRRLIVIVFGTIGIASFFASVMLYHHLMSVSPTVPILATNQIYQLNQHGYLFYVSHQQYVLFRVLMIGGWGLGVFAAILNYRWKVVHNLTRDGWRLPT
jgi:hypothetical protein